MLGITIMLAGSSAKIHHVAVSNGTPLVKSLEIVFVAFELVMLMPTLLTVMNLPIFCAPFGFTPRKNCTALENESESPLCIDPRAVLPSGAVSKNAVSLVSAIRQVPTNGALVIPHKKPPPRNIVVSYGSLTL